MHKHTHTQTHTHIHLSNGAAGTDHDICVWKWEWGRWHKNLINITNCLKRRKKKKRIYVSDYKSNIFTAGLTVDILQPDSPAAHGLLCSFQIQCQLPFSQQFHGFWQRRAVSPKTIAKATKRYWLCAIIGLYIIIIHYAIQDVLSQSQSLSGIIGLYIIIIHYAIQDALSQSQSLSQKS